MMYDVERRIREETNIPTDNLRKACARCHSFARPLSWRRSLDDWKQFVDMHAAQYKVARRARKLSLFSRRRLRFTLPNGTPGAARTHRPNLTGRWLVTASIPGRGKFYGEMQVDPAGEDEFNTSVRLTSVSDGSSIVRSGRSVVYGGYAWRGRSKGNDPASSAPDDLSSETREVLWISPDQSTGRRPLVLGTVSGIRFRCEPAPGLLRPDVAA